MLATHARSVSRLRCSDLAVDASDQTWWSRSRSLYPTVRLEPSRCEPPSSRSAADPTTTCWCKCCARQSTRHIDVREVTQTTRLSIPQLYTINRSDSVSGRDILISDSKLHGACHAPACCNASFTDRPHRENQCHKTAQDRGRAGSPQTSWCARLGKNTRPGTPFSTSLTVASLRMCTLSLMCSLTLRGPQPSPRSATDTITADRCRPWRSGPWTAHSSPG
jgi:hypothetical protein